MAFPRTLQEFQAQFPNDEACWERLRQARWRAGFACTRCGHAKSFWISTRRLAQCEACRYQCSVTAGTIFHRTKMPLRTWFWAIFFVARHKSGISAKQLQRDTGIGCYETAWTMLHKIRSALQPRPAHRLAGIVEVDETYVGGRERGRRGGRQAGTKTIVAVAVEQRLYGAGRVRLSAIHGVSFERDLGPFVLGVVDVPNTTLHTDGYGSYSRFPEAGVRVKQQIQGSPERAGVILPWSHRIFGNLKTWLRGTFHGVSKKHMQRYLDEFVYRFDRRWRETEMFGFVLERALRGTPLAYSQLVAESGR